MTLTVELLDMAKTAQGISSDYRLAKVLGVSCHVVSNYRRGASAPMNAIYIVAHRPCLNARFAHMSARASTPKPPPCMRIRNLLALAPGVLPPLSVLLLDLGEPSSSQLAYTLGVNERTCRRWMASDAAPRATLLALFWMTKWGRSALECSALNDAQLACELAEAHRRAADARAAQVERLLALGDFGAANAPLVTSS